MRCAIHVTTVNPLLMNWGFTLWESVDSFVDELGIYTLGIRQLALNELWMFTLGIRRLFPCELRFSLWESADSLLTN